MKYRARLVRVQGRQDGLRASELPEGQACSRVQGRLDGLRAAGASRGPGLFVRKGVWMVYELRELPAGQARMVYELRELPEGQACSYARASGCSTSFWSFPRARLVRVQGRLDGLQAPRAWRGPGLFVCKGVWMVYIVAR